MATNIALDDSLLTEAQELGRFKSKEDTVNTALKEFIERRKQKEIVTLFGKFAFDEDYDYKKGR